MSDSVGYNVVVTCYPQKWASLVPAITDPVILATSTKSWSEAVEGLDSSSDRKGGWRTYSDKKGQRSASFSATTDQTQDFVELSKIIESSAAGSHKCDIVWSDYGNDATHNTPVYSKSGVFVLLSVESKLDANGKAEYTFKFESDGPITSTGNLSGDLELEEGA